MGFEVYVAKSYERGKLTLREAADLLHLNLIEMIDLLIEMGVRGNIKAKDVLESLKTLNLPKTAQKKSKFDHHDNVHKI